MTPTEFKKRLAMSGIRPKSEPRAAQPAAPPAAQLNRPRILNLVMCRDCGQNWEIAMSGGSMNVAPVSFCPACGHQSLERVASSFGSLDKICTPLHCPRELAQLLYEQWAANNHNEQRRWPAFVDYLKSRLKGE